MHVRLPGLIFLLCSLNVFGQEYGFRCFMLEDGLPRAHVTTVQEDEAGFLLIGTKNGGVARFDGQHMLVLDVNDGLSDNDIICSAVDTNKADRPIWIGAGHQVNGFQGNRIIKLDHEFNSEVSALAIGRTGELLIGTQANGLYELKGDRIHPFAEPNPFKHVVDVAVGDCVYAATERGVFRHCDAEWEQLPGYMPSGSVIDLMVRDTLLLIATEHEVDVYNNGSIRSIALPEGEFDVQCVFLDKQNRIWIGTSDGAFKVDKDGRTVLFTERSGLSDSDIRTIYQDRSGAVWLGTAFGGLCKFTSEAFIHYSTRSGLGENIVSGTLRDRTDRLWISTYGGGICMVSNGEVSRYTTWNGLPSDQVLSMCAHPRSGVFAATDKGPVFLSGDGIIEIPTEGMRVTSMIVDADGDLWLAGIEGWKELTKSGENWVLKREVKAGVGYVSDMDTLDQVLYASTDQGLYVLDRSSLRRVERDGLPEDVYTSVAIGSNGDIWAGTSQQGLVRITNDTVEIYGTASGLSADQIELVMLDAYENVWVGTKRGIDMLELDVLQEYVLDVENYTTEDGFIGMEVFRNAGMLDEDGTLWFGTTMGATRYDADKLLFDNSEPNTRITDILLNYESFDWTRYSIGIDSLTGLPDQLSLPYDRNHLTFDFAGVSLAYPDRVRYQYILENYDPDWSPITKTNRVTYSNIPPGNYSFKVISRNASGIWNQEPVSLEFEIRAPIWQNKVFLGGLALMLVLLVYVIVKLRERRFMKEQTRLETMVEHRTQELSQAKQRSENLLLNILPTETAKELRDHGKARAREYDECSVLFSDFKGFTAFSSEMNGEELVAELDGIFRTFDSITDKYKVEKIKTIGDAYMCASGLPEHTRWHALNTVLMGLEMIHAMKLMNVERERDGRQQWHLRVGIHSGPLVAGVVGEKKFAYDIWGDTVNTASRMEHYSEPGRLNISGVTLSHVMDYVDTSVRGPLSVKGKGQLMMYFVERIKPEFSADPDGFHPTDELLEMLGLTGVKPVM